jgi:hypothetical protein
MLLNITSSTVQPPPFTTASPQTETTFYLDLHHFPLSSLPTVSSKHTFFLDQFCLQLVHLLIQFKHENPSCSATMQPSALSSDHLRMESTDTEDTKVANDVHSAEMNSQQTQSLVDSSGDEKSDKMKSQANDQPSFSDPWFQKHGVKGFQRWDLLTEDMPADRLILGSSYRGVPQLSPRSEARSLAQVNSQTNWHGDIWLTLTE